MTLSEQITGIIAGLVIFAVGITIIAIGSDFEGAAQSAAIIVGIVTMLSGAFVLYKTAKA